MIVGVPQSKGVVATACDVEVLAWVNSESPDLTTGMALEKEIWLGLFELIDLTAFCTDEHAIWLDVEGNNAWMEFGVVIHIDINFVRFD